MTDVPPIRKLYRSKTNRMLAGVCGGFAEYFNVDPTLMRVLTVVLALLTGGIVLIAYVVGMFIIPESPSAQ